MLFSLLLFIAVCIHLFTKSNYFTKNASLDKNDRRNKDD